MIFNLNFSQKSKDDVDFHKKSGNKIVLKKIFLLIEEIEKHPFTGTGKPEQLKHNLSGKWSRRINKEHRLVYEIEDENIKILSVKGHYD